MAIVSLVTAFVLSVAGVIFGHVALSQIKRTGERGRGLAIGGLVVGYLGLAIGFIWAVVIVAFIIFAAAVAPTDVGHDVGPTFGNDYGYDYGADS